MNCLWQDPVDSVCHGIGAGFGLPQESVALRRPAKKVLRSDASIRPLRKRWK